MTPNTMKCLLLTILVLSASCQDVPLPPSDEPSPYVQAFGFGYAGNSASSSPPSVESAPVSPSQESLLSVEPPVEPPVESPVIPDAPLVAPIPEERHHFPQVPVSGKVNALHQKVVSVQQKVVPVQQQVVPVQQKVIPVQQKVVPVQQKVIPVQQKVVPVQQKVIPVQQQVVVPVIPVQQKVVVPVQQHVEPQLLPVKGGYPVQQSPCCQGPMFYPMPCCQKSIIQKPVAPIIKAKIGPQTWSKIFKLAMLPMKTGAVAGVVGGVAPIAASVLGAGVGGVLAKPVIIGSIAAPPVFTSVAAAKFALPRLLLGGKVLTPAVKGNVPQLPVKV